MTPLIDVLLVLMVMFILTIPATTHNVTFDLPTVCDDCPPVQENYNVLTLDGGDRLLWNGTPIARESFPALIAASSQMVVEPELRFAPDARASYDAAARIVATIKASGVTRFGFVDNERFRVFGR